jgi:hypothetical protein
MNRFLVAKGLEELLAHARRGRRPLWAAPMAERGTLRAAGEDLGARKAGPQTTRRDASLRGWLPQRVLCMLRRTFTAKGSFPWQGRRS